MRLAAVALLLIATAGAGCGGDGSAAPAREPNVVTYAATTNRLCTDLVGALRRAFDEAPDDPDAAIARYAREVGDAGRRFAAVPPPRSLARFGATAARHVRREAGVLRQAARRSAAGDSAAAIRALGRHGALLPAGIPTSVLRRAPACGAVAPAAPSPDGTVVSA